MQMCETVTNLLENAILISQALSSIPFGHFSDSSDLVFILHLFLKLLMFSFVRATLRIVCR